ncbi:uncharacterized protein [Saccopteryx bilineata]|uniref:uncharacterized protein n=1 Tax=Saccopteryx bilineata TaxID=59482 RepID=UPI00338D4860
MEHSMALKRLKNEFLHISQNPPVGCSAGPIADNIFEWQAIIIGPSGSPYEGGIFTLKMVFPCNYPFKPPKIQFATKIYHPNIDRQGTICMNLLSLDWSPIVTVSKLLQAICSMLSEPVMEDMLVPEITKIYLKDRAKYELLARAYTEKYAI